MSTPLSIHLRARLQPVDRGDLYVDPLQEILDAHAPGCAVTGGGTLLDAGGEPQSCDIELDLEGDASAVLRLVIRTLESCGAPRGSKAFLDDAEPVPFGVTEGLGVYLNGTELPEAVYADGDINELAERLIEQVGDAGRLQSYWEGPTETALYFYGPSASRMYELMSGVLATHPLAERSRVVPLTERA